MKNTRLFALALQLGLILLVSGCGETPPSTLGAAASLREVMPKLMERFERETGLDPPRVTYGASGSLARQLEAEAPMEGLILASRTLQDSLAAKGCVEADSLRTLATNRLVLAGRRHTEPLERLTRDHVRLAMGDPRFVPAGSFTRAALESTGQWEAVAARAVFTRDVTAAVALLRRGEVEGAFVYATDVLAHPDLVLLQELALPQGIVPSVVASRRSGSQALARFFRFLQSSGAAAIFSEHGFEVALP